jgi:hypothetical protein
MNLLNNNKTIIIIIIIIALFIILLSMLLIYYNKNKLKAGDISFDKHCSEDITEYTNYVNEYENYMTEIEAKYIGGWCYPGIVKMQDFYQNYDREYYSMNGWKIHISPSFKNALKVLKIVCKYHKTSKLGFTFKCIDELNRYHQYVSKINLRNYDAIRGKFIAIYTRSDREAVQIANDLNVKFRKNGLLRTDDFITIKNDFQIYPGIYTRLCNYADKYGATRDTVGVLYDELYAYLTLTKKIFTEDIPNIEYDNYVHPFNTLKFNNHILPKNVCVINDLLVSKNIIDDVYNCINKINNPYYIYAIKIMEHYKELPDIMEIIKNDETISANVKDNLDNVVFGDSLKTYYKYKKLLELHQKLECKVSNEDLRNYLRDNDIRSDEQSFIRLLIKFTETNMDNIKVSIYERLQNIFNHNPEYYVFNMDEFIDKNEFLDTINIDVDKLIRKLNKLIDLYNSLNQRVRDYGSYRMWNSIQSIDFKFGFDYELLNDDNDDEARDEVIRMLFDANVNFKDVIKYNDIPHTRDIDIDNGITQKFSYFTPIEYQKDNECYYDEITNWLNDL